MNNYSKENKEKVEKSLGIIEKMRFCGCGYPEKAYETLLEILNIYENHDEKREAWLDKLGNGYSYLLLYFLDAAGLLEHGGSVGGAWLSSDGKTLKEFLETFGCDPDDWR